MQPLTLTAADRIASHTAPSAQKRDPAPSRLRYRVQRLWLTPIYRSALRIGLPVFLLITAVGWYFSIPANRYGVAEKYGEIRRSIETRPEFMVRLLSIKGASPLVEGAIRRIVPANFPVSSFDLDLDVLKSQIVALDAIESAALRIRPGGVLEVSVRERRPVLVWRAPASIELIDATGHRVATLTDREARPDLPLVAGAGADKVVPQARAILAAAAPLADRLRGLVRIGERRWDVWLTGGQKIELPEQDPVAALEQVLALDQAQDLLARNVTLVDMRNPERPTLRLAAPALTELRHIRSLSME